MKTFAWVTGLLVAGVVAAGSVAAIGCGDPGAGSAASAETADEQLAQDIHAQGGVMIQPAKKGPNGILPPGGPKTWTYLPKGASGHADNIFTSMLKTSGINPCSTIPETLSGHPGFLDVIDFSMVLNPGGTRATFGYWLTANDGKAWFVLFSYDHIDVNGACQCAEEVFLFGPMILDVNGVPVPNPPPLADGLAVNGDGKLLPAVPLTIADAFNYEGGGKYLDGSKSKPKGTAVTPGVDENGKGCRLCHGTNVDEIPQATRKFPWFAVPDPDGGAPDGGDAGTDGGDDAGDAGEPRPARVG